MSIKLSCNSLRQNIHMSNNISYFNHQGCHPTQSWCENFTCYNVKGKGNLAREKFNFLGNLVKSVWKDIKLVCFLGIHSNSVGNQTINRNYCTSSHCSCHHFPKQNHGWSWLELQSKKLLCCGLQVVEVVTLFAVVPCPYWHCKYSHSGKWGRQSSLQMSALILCWVGEDANQWLLFMFSYCFRRAPN